MPIQMIDVKRHPEERNDEGSHQSTEGDPSLHSGRRICFVSLTRVIKGVLDSPDVDIGRTHDKP